MRILPAQLGYMCSFSLSCSRLLSPASKKFGVAILRANSMLENKGSNHCNPGYTQISPLADSKRGFAGMEPPVRSY